MPTSAACPICAAPDCPLAWHYQAHAIHRCPVCQLEFVHPLAVTGLDYYQANYSQPVLEAVQSSEPHIGFRYALEKFDRIQQRFLAPRQRRVLDVGCGMGYLLSELQKRGFDCQGIDFDASLVEYARQHYHLNARVATLETLGALNERFDVVILNHVLEHSAAPLQLLQDIRAVLNPDGLVFIDVPNLSRFLLRRAIRRGDCGPGEYPPHHLTFWTRAALTRALRQAGYRVLDCEPRPFNQEGQTSLFLSNRLGLRHPAALAWAQTGLQFAGRLFGLPGDTLFGVGRPAGAAE